MSFVMGNGFDNVWCLFLLFPVKKGEPEIRVCFKIIIWEKISTSPKLGTLIMQNTVATV